MYVLIDAYVFPKSSHSWLVCPNCGLKPKVWIFDNGASTGCGCNINRYDHFSIHAESIMSFYTNNSGDTSKYDRDQLRKNWNIWVSSGIVTFEHASMRSDNRW
jgi:hypothetical protein